MMVKPEIVGRILAGYREQKGLTQDVLSVRTTVNWNAACAVQLWRHFLNSGRLLMFLPMTLS